MGFLAQIKIINSSCSKTTSLHNIPSYERSPY